MIFENGQVTMESKSTREAAGNTSGRSFSDCDDSCPISYSADPALIRGRETAMAIGSNPLRSTSQSPETGVISWRRE